MTSTRRLDRQKILEFGKQNALYNQYSFRIFPVDGESVNFWQKGHKTLFYNALSRLYHFLEN